MTIGPILDPDNFNRPIEAWSSHVKTTFYPKSEAESPSMIPEKPPDFASKYLRAFLAEHERLRLSVLWYYTRDILQEDEFLAGVQEKAKLAQESTGWDYAVIGILDVDVYIRLATVGLELGILPRGETLCAHTVTQPPGVCYSSSAGCTNLLNMTIRTFSNYQVSRKTGDSDNARILNVVGFTPMRECHCA